MAAVLVLNLLRSEYPDEPHERPGQRCEEVEDDAQLGNILHGWNIKTIKHFCRVRLSDGLTCVHVLRLTEPVVEEVNDWREQDQSSGYSQPDWDMD